MRQAHFLTELVDCESASTGWLSLLQGFMPNVLRAVSVNALLHGGKTNKETSELASIKSNRDLDMFALQGYRPEMGRFS